MPAAGAGKLVLQSRPARVGAGHGRASAYKKTPRSACRIAGLRRPSASPRPHGHLRKAFSPAHGLHVLRRCYLTHEDLAGTTKRHLTARKHARHACSTTASFHHQRKRCRLLHRIEIGDNDKLSAASSASLLPADLLVILTPWTASSKIFGKASAQTIAGPSRTIRFRPRKHRRRNCQRRRLFGRHEFQKNFPLRKSSCAPASPARHRPRAAKKKVLGQNFSTAKGGKGHHFFVPQPPGKLQGPQSAGSPFFHHPKGNAVRGQGRGKPPCVKKAASLSWPPGVAALRRAEVSPPRRCSPHLAIWTAPSFARGNQRVQAPPEMENPRIRAAPKSIHRDNLVIL